MDDDDYSWVRRTRFSHSVIRSNSGREQFGAFVEQFNRGAALKQKRFDSEFKPHGLHFEPRTKIPATNSGNSFVREKISSVHSSVPRSKSLMSRPRPGLEDSPSDSNPKQHEKASSHCRLLQEESTRQDDSAGNGKRSSLFVDVCHKPEKFVDMTVESSGPLDFSFHSDDQSMSLQRVCSSPSPFPIEKTSGVDTLPSTRSSSLKVLGEGRKPMLRARSPFPSRPMPELFVEAKSASKRFSTPPPRRKSASPPRASNGRSPPVDFAPVRAPVKPKHRKDCWDNGRAKAEALKVLEKWSVDRSQLLIGHRFASGAHSRLFHGIYMEQPVAVKFIRQPDDEEDAELAAQLEKQFNTEIVTLSRLQHRNVIKLVGACSSPPVFCVITEFLSGGSLRAFLHRQEHKSLPLGQIISVGLDIAHGIGYIHSQGVIHRDVKPENIIFDGECCAKIVDFGIACEEAYCDPLGNDPGTFRWMAPEMMKHKPYGRKVDVYSFGLILWEMFTGSVPYEDLTPFQAAFAVFDKNVRPAIPSSCPAALQLLIEQCWALQPDKRPDFWQIVKVLEKFKMVLDRDGTLDNMPGSHCQETHDHKKWLAHWVQKLKHSHHDLSGPPRPKLL